MIRIPNVKCPVGKDIYKIVKKLTGTDVKIKIVKKSIDARRKSDVHFVYTVDVESPREETLLKKVKTAFAVKEKPYVFPNGAKILTPVVIAGSGPAGLMCGLTLAQNGYKVIILERGRNVERRRKDVESFWNGGELKPESNVQFGEGGAGTFSDGKLNTGVKDTRIRHVLEEFHRHGAPEEILYLAKPHVGTDNLYTMVSSIRNEIISLGGEVRFSSKLDGLVIENGALKGVDVSNYEKEEQYIIETENLVLAIGHSARDTFEMLHKSGVEMEQKSFSMGVRIEHLQEDINKTQYGEFHQSLGAADYKISVHLPNGRGVYTFCMCPGGVVVASASEKGGIVTNGMSYFDRDGKNANSALLVNVAPEDFGTDDVLGGMYMQRDIEKKAFEISRSYKAPSQSVGEFVFGDSKCMRDAKISPTYLPGTVHCDIGDIFPEFITESLKAGIKEMDKRLPGFADKAAIITAPETRSSSPVRILRDTKHRSNINGVYPCGEGAGYAGGITSAAVDGIKTAEMVAVNAGGIK